MCRLHLVYDCNKIFPSFRYNTRQNLLSQSTLLVVIASAGRDSQRSLPEVSHLSGAIADVRPRCSTHHKTRQQNNAPNANPYRKESHLTGSNTAHTASLDGLESRRTTSKPRNHRVGNSAAQLELGPQSHQKISGEYKF